MQTEINTPSIFTKTIWASKRDDFTAKIKKLNKLLVKYGKSPISYSFTNFRSLPVSFTSHTKGDAFANDKIKTAYVEHCDVVCSGLTTVKKDDTEYTYIGSISLKDGVKQIFVKDEAYLDYFDSKFRPNFCDHCNSSRYRNSYHLFVTPDNKVLQIGATCAKSYFGISSIAFLSGQMDTFSVSYEGCEDDLQHFSKGSTTFFYEELYPFLDFLTKGFTHWNKSSPSYDPEAPIQTLPTSFALSNILSTPHHLIPKHYYGNNPIQVSLSEALAYWNSQPTSAFSINCREALKAGYCTSHSLGSFAYAIFAAVNHKVKLSIDAQTNSISAPCPFPINSRQTLTATILSFSSYEVETFYSYRCLLITKYAINLIDSNKTLYHISTSSPTFANCKRGDLISLKATISDTKPFKGINYTHLARPKLISIVSPLPFDGYGYVRGTSSDSTSAT